MRKEYSKRKNCQEDLWQKTYLDGWIKGMMRNIGEGQKEIRDDGREDDPRKEEQ